MRRTTTLFVAVLALLHGIDSSTWAADVAIGVMRDGRPDYLTRTSDEIDRTTVEQGFRHPAQSVAFLFASDLPRDERSLGYEPCLPDARIDRSNGTATASACSSRCRIDSWTRSTRTLLNRSFMHSFHHSSRLKGSHRRPSWSGEVMSRDIVPCRDTCRSRRR